MHQQQTALENIVGKGKNARNKQLLLFSNCFLLNQIIVTPFVHIFDISLFGTELEETKIGISGKGQRNKKFWKEFYRLTQGTSMWNFAEIKEVVSEKKIFKFTIICNGGKISPAHNTSVFQRI